MHSSTAVSLTSLLLASYHGAAHALSVDLNSPDSIKSAAKIVAQNVVGIYNTPSADVPGIFPTPYYWGDAGLAWDTLLNYWARTGDDEYNHLITESLLWQAGPDANYLPPNQTKDEGNDDQSTWALACMTAAENNFPYSTSSSPYGKATATSWLQLAQNVFDSQVARWDNSTCGGGLRWQIFPFNAGYEYKNAASNGNFMQLAARLYHYTGNKTYSDWAIEVATWSGSSGLINAKTQAVYDGMSTTSNCSVSRIQWSSNLGTYLAAISYTSGALPPSYLNAALSSFVDTIPRFFTSSGGVLIEAACEPQHTCNNEEYAFLGILTRAMATTIALSNNSTRNANLARILRTSAQGAAAQCSGGNSGTVCGADWSSSTYDGTKGLGQELSALNVLLANLHSTSPQTGTSTTNTTSTSSNGTTNTASTSSNASNKPSRMGAGSLLSSLFVLGIVMLLCQR